ncbi:hypothetical protein RHOSPDRAFT_36880 [Rhodotorula sp. JG-1b]|nr:hypothetical protein RHOSPDRAFT_36880 [Rhodotorula sp. JG-1b]
MTAADAFVSDSTHSYNGNCYFVHVDPNLAQLIRDAATVVARVTPNDGEESAAWVDSLVQRAQDALPPAPAPAPTPADEADSAEDAAPRPAEESPELKATKRDLVRQLVARLQEGRAKLQALADRDFVGFTNSFLSLVLETQQDADLAHGIEVLVAAIACKDPKPATTQPALSTRYSTLATVFNALPSSLSTLRLQVLRTLVKYAAENDDVAIVKPALDPLQLEQYFAEAGAGAGADETAASLVESLLNNVGGGNGAKAATDPIGTVTLAREILVARLSSSSSAAPSASPVRSKLAATLIALLLASNDVYDFTPYRVLPFPAESSEEATTSVLAETFKRLTDPSSSGGEQAAAAAAADEFASQDELDKAVASTTLFPSSPSPSPSSSSSSSESAPSAATPARTAHFLLRVDRDQLLKKQTLLRFARLCEDKGVGKSVRYDEIAKRLGLSASAGAGASGGEEEDEEAGEEVETWVIDAIRASLVQGRLSQPTQSFLITRVAPLSFASSSSSSSSSTSSWQVIQERLEGWKGALDRVTATVEKSLAVSGASSSQGGARGGGRFGAEELVNHHHQQAVEA